MSQDTRIALIDFHGRQMLSFNDGQSIRVAIRPICDALGIDWPSQLRKIKSDPVLSQAVGLSPTPGEHGAHEMVTLPLDLTQGWLFKLNPDKVKPEARDLVLFYQRECYQVLSDYWLKGAAINPRATRALSLDRGAAQDRLVRLIDKLRATREPEARRIIHTLMQQVCEELGVEPPVANAIGSASMSADDLAQRLFAGLARIDEQGDGWDHSNDSGFIALRLRQVQALFREHAIPVRIDRTMREALMLSRDPEYAGQKTVRSAIDGKSTHCWVFRRLMPWQQIA